MSYEYTTDGRRAALCDPATGEEIARIDYRVADAHYELDYLWVDPSRRGQGLARAMLDRFAEFVRADGGTITAHCGVAEKMMIGDARYEDLLT